MSSAFTALKRPQVTLASRTAEGSRPYLPQLGHSFRNRAHMQNAPEGRNVLSVGSSPVGRASDLAMSKLV